MRVGGNLDGGKMDGETWAMEGGSIEYGGSCTPSIQYIRPGGYSPEQSCGSMFVGLNATIKKRTLDRAPWDALFSDLQAKSRYWYGLTPNGVFINSRGGPENNTMIMYAGDSQRVQVFTFDRFDLVDLWNIRLDSSLIGRTILINVFPYDINGNKGPVRITNIGAFYDPWGGSDLYFSPAIKESLLWNFYGATKMTLGPGGGIRLPGSILIPDGDLDMLWQGQDGRTIVKGNVLHNSRGSVFANYEFDPPFPLPLPPTLPVVRNCATIETIAVTL